MSPRVSRDSKALQGYSPFYPQTVLQVIKKDIEIQREAEELLLSDLPGFHSDVFLGLVLSGLLKEMFIYILNE